MGEEFDLRGRVAVVTGGAGILGRRFCHILARYGARVAVVDLDLDAARALAGQIEEEIPGAEAEAVRCDVGDPGSVAAMVRRVVDRFGRIDILHNNAATKGPGLERFCRPFEEYSLEDWQAVMHINVDGMFLVAQAVGKRMVEQGEGGCIVQTSSIYGVMAPDQRIYEGSEYQGVEINTPAVYSTSKAAVIGLTRHLATYWAPRGIRVNALCPGGVESGQNETFKRNYAARVPLGRMARDSEMEGALLYLVSDAASYVTGQCLVVDGGLSAW